MRAPRFSIRALLFATALVAVDCALIRIFGSTPGLFFWMITSFSTLNILAVVCYRNIVRGAAMEPFFLGFATFGAISVLLWLNWCAIADDDTIVAVRQGVQPVLENLPYINQIGETIGDDLGLYRFAFVIVVTFLFFLMIAPLPHLVIAFAGGWLGARLALVLRRGGRSVEDSSACVVQGDPGGDA